MNCSQTSNELCPLLLQDVKITVSADVEAGGYGCAVLADDLEYTCSEQSGCPFAQHAGCLLVQQ